MQWETLRISFESWNLTLRTNMNLRDYIILPYRNWSWVRKTNLRSMKAVGRGRQYLPKIISDSINTWGLIAYNDKNVVGDENSAHFDVLKLLQVVANAVTHQFFGNHR